MRFSGKLDSCGDSMQLATEEWVSFVLEYYKDFRDLTQVHARGFFAGMSDREIVGLAVQLKKNADKYPV